MIRQTLAGLVVLVWSFGAQAACNLPIETPLQAVFLPDPHLFNDKTAGTQVLPLYANTAHAPLGQMQIHFSPQGGARFLYNQTGKPSQPFTPTIFDADWGYGPWAHQTFISRSDNLYNVVLPGGDNGYTTAWVQLTKPQVYTFKAFDAVTYNNTPYIIRSIQKGVVRLVLESDVLKGAPEGDTCERVLSGKSTWVSAVKTPDTIVKIKDLYDDQCQLKLRVTYTRGC